ncbi:MAG: branched-chain amino acid ABC transporter substrate-binding protein, partial [Pseudomonadota bacterium]
AIGIVAQAIGNLIRQDKALTRDNVRDEIAATTDYPGVGGPNTFDEIGDVVKPMRVLQIKDGQYTMFDE